MSPLPTLSLSPLLTIEVQLGKPEEMGATPGGHRRIVPIVGGRFFGERLNGVVRNFGADWQTIRPDGLAEIDTRYMLETDDGAILDIRNIGVRHGPPDIMARVGRGEAVDPALYYMRTHSRLETGDPRYQWLNRLICLGTGARSATTVTMVISAVE
ncbi:Protein of unknown function [Devosia enhydra]|uniref:UPF0311 protein SAMN02983003_1408 n=1 Tax=Devosia enhydra TaxID=665118 RepID=A0A1K2HXJ1_9HYPH|nr:DUF3237 domain-containing protein [Devosia enhydra]SFZ83014.1 Protein of unknown function [Devosia enhydra]